MLAKEGSAFDRVTLGYEDVEHKTEDHKILSNKTFFYFDYFNRCLNYFPNTIFLNTVEFSIPSFKNNISKKKRTHKYVCSKIKKSYLQQFYISYFNENKLFTNELSRI